MIDRKTLIRRLSLAVYFAAAFLAFLLLLFPLDRIKARLENEVQQRAALDLTVSRISPRFFNSFTLTDVVLSDQKGKVLFESPSVRTSVSLFNLLRGMLSLDMNAKAYGGDLLVKMQQGGGQQHFVIDADGLDIASYTALRDYGLKLTGKLGGMVEMSGDSGRGRLWLKGLTSRELKIKGFSIPDLDFDQCWFEADIKGDRMTIRKLELDGKELKIQCLGDVVLRERGTLNLTVKIKPSERLAREQAAILSLLRNRSADGFYQFGIGGTLAEPLPRL
jgi:type II secretion system protein N